MIQLLSRLWSTLIRLLVVVFGLMMVVGVMAVGAVLGIVLVGWALLRGRSAPPVTFRWNGPLDWQRSNRAAERAGANTGRDVVDIDAHEVDPVSARGRPNPRLDLPPR